MKRNKKGFTLAELLVVIAIIAVLTAIAIPVFTAATGKAEEATEVANARSMYAEGMVEVAGETYTTTKSETWDGKTYTFSYDEDATTEPKWNVAVTGTGAINANYGNKGVSTTKDFGSVVLDGETDT